MRRDIPAILKIMQGAVGRPVVVSSNNPFRVLISTVLSQRTLDKNTEKAAKQLFEKYGTAEGILAAPLASIREAIRPAGFYKVKAKRIKEISRQILKRFNGKVPKNVQQLLSLPGVGRKTANCVLVYGFRQPAIPVDIHLHRVSNRIGLVTTKAPEQTEQALTKLIPKQNWLELNHLMIRFGQTVCLPRNPKCIQCKIRARCRHFLLFEGKKQI